MKLRTELPSAGLLLRYACRGGLPVAMKFEDYISVSSEVRSGKPGVKGTRITVADILEYLAAGMSEGKSWLTFPRSSPNIFEPASLSPPPAKAISPADRASAV